MSERIFIMIRQKVFLDQDTKANEATTRAIEGSKHTVKVTKKTLDCVNYKASESVSDKCLLSSFYPLVPEKKVKIYYLMSVTQMI